LKIWNVIRGIEVQNYGMKHILYLSLAASIFLLAGCTGATSPDQIVFPASNVSYAKDIEPYFALACVQCHDEGSSNVDLTSCIAIQDDLGVVVMEPTTPPVGDTTASSLVLVMYGKVPHTLLNANDNQRQGIKRWVIEGAQNN
jgi:hypothetical protein